jgi:phosphopentomutase
MGLISPKAFPTYPRGFPAEIVGAFEERIGRGILGNKPASGTAIIAELGAQHVASGRPIVYTSADSVFQIAAHVDVVPLDLLYEWCRSARELLQGPDAVARVIARPFTGTQGAFVRTKDRRDFSLEPPGPLYLDLLEESGVPVLALGKLNEIFVGRGVTTALKVASNDENLALVSDLVCGRSDRARFDEGLLFTNLVDFDMVWGHRNDVDGFAAGLEAVDRALRSIVGALRTDDLVIVTADHGVDPTTVSTDHSREYVPLLVYPRPPGSPASVYEGAFSDTGATVFHHLTGKSPALEGTTITAPSPTRGWRRYTWALPVGGGAGLSLSGRIGPAEAAEAAGFLAGRLGEAPEVAIVLGSGLHVALDDPPLVSLSYPEVPHWPSGTVAGHPHRLTVGELGGRRVVSLHGRPHEYEGFDLSEVQLPVRTLARWGVRRLVLTSASGAVAQIVRSIVAATEVLDFHYPLSDGGPARLPATDTRLVARFVAAANGSVVSGVHASLPGPQYETPAELEVLRQLGAATISMSPAAEVRAANDEGLELAVLAVVVNAGDTTHEQVLAAAAAAGGVLSGAVETLLALWDTALP